MPQKTMAYVENLVAACEAREAELPQIGPFVADLEAALAEAAAAKRRQADLEKRRKQATREANEQWAECVELATRLQCFLVAFYGPKDERLALFGIKRLEGRRRKQNGSPGIH